MTPNYFSGSTAHPLSRRKSPRINKFHHEDDLLHTRRPKTHAGYRQDDRSQGVLPPFPDVTALNKLDNASGVSVPQGSWRALPP